MPARKRLTSLAGTLLCLVMLMLAPLALAGGVKSTTYYNLHYESWESMANAMIPYLDAAFTSASSVLGYGNQGYDKIDIYFVNEPKNWADGYYINDGSNALYLNMAGYPTASMANAKSADSIIAHETTHLLFYHKIGGYSSSLDWYNEALAYYVGNVVYSYGSQYGKSEIGASLSYYSRRGATKSSWFDTAVRYGQGSSTTFDWWQLNAIGYYLNSVGKWDGIQQTLTYLASGRSLESSLIATYGKSSGQFDTSTGAGANTLYSDYYYYYFGHY